LSVFCRAIAVGVVGPCGGADLPASVHSPKRNPAEARRLDSN
jgi:hypothetical protein